MVDDRPRHGGTCEHAQPPATLPFQVGDFSPRRPFSEVLDLIRTAYTRRRFDEACDLLLVAYRPVLDRIAFQLERARGLEHGRWLSDARVLVHRLVLRELASVVHNGKPVQSLEMVLRGPVQRAWDADRAARHAVRAD